MTDFLSSRFGQPERIDLGDDYFVEVCKLAKGDHAACHNRLTKMRLEAHDGASPTSTGEVDFAGYQEELVVRSIRDWNLDGPNGPLPLHPIEARRASYRQLPTYVADQLFEVCERLNRAPSKDDEARFREAGVGGAEGPAGEGDDGPVGDAPVPPGARPVGVAGAVG